MERCARLLVPPMEGKHNLIRLIPTRSPTTIFSISSDIFTSANCCAISFWTFDLGNLLILGISLVLGIAGVGIYWCWNFLLAFGISVMGFGVGIDFWDRVSRDPIGSHCHELEFEI